MGYLLNQARIMQHLLLVHHLQSIHTDFLVRGERIPYEEATKQEPDTNIKPELSFTAKVLIVTIIVIFIGLMIAVIYSIRDRKRRKVR